MASLKRPGDRIAHALYMNKTHEDYCVESEAAIAYLPHLETADQPSGHSLEDLNCTPVSNDSQEYQSIQLAVKRYRDLYAGRAIANHKQGQHDFFLRIQDLEGQIKNINLHKTLVVRHDFLNKLFEKFPESTMEVPVKLNLDNPWYNARAFQFAIACILGEDPNLWFDSRTTIEQSIPDCVAPSIRDSMNRMLHGLYFLRALTKLNLPRPYLSMGTIHVIRQMDIWNIELILGYLLQIHRRYWEDVPSHVFPTTFEPMSRLEIFTKNVYVQEIVEDTAHTLIKYVSRFLRKKMVLEEKLSIPYQSCPLLGATQLPTDCIDLPKLPEVIAEYKFNLATLRIAAASPEGWDDDIAWTEHILPSILVSLPYGILKQTLYHNSRFSARQTYDIAQRILGWREHRRTVWLEHIQDKQDVYIFWKRRAITNDPQRSPSEARLPQHFRWVEVAYLKKAPDPNNGNQLTESFDFKRYRYQWQCVYLDELEAILPLITAADNARPLEASSKQVTISGHVMSANLVKDHTAAQFVQALTTPVAPRGGLQQSNTLQRGTQQSIQQQQRQQQQQQRNRTQHHGSWQLLQQQPRLPNNRSQANSYLQWLHQQPRPQSNGSRPGIPQLSAQQARNQQVPGQQAKKMN